MYENENENGKELYEKNFENSISFPRIFNSDSVVQGSKTEHEEELITLVHSQKK